MRWSALIFLLTLSLELSAQDWFVLKTSDTIYCKITEIDLFYIYYKSNSADSTKSIDRNLVEVYHKEASRDNPIKIYYSDEQLKILATGLPPSRGFQFGIAAGYSYRLVQVPRNESEPIQDHVRRLKSGFNIKADLAYFFGRYFGLGIKYTFSNAKSKTDNAVYGFTPLGSQYFAIASDNISIHYIALHPTARVGPRSARVHFLPGITFGYSAIVNNSNFGHDFTLKGGGFGFSIDLGLEFKATQGLYLGANAELAFGSVKNYHYDDGTTQRTFNLSSENAVNLNRIDLSFSIRYYLQ